MWYQLGAAAIGIWLMCAPSALGFGRPAATSAWTVGPLVASFGAIALWEVTRSVRSLNPLLGAWLVLAPLVLHHPPAAAVNSVVSGMLIIVLSLPGGARNHRFGGGWSSLWRGDTEGRLRDRPEAA